MSKQEITQQCYDALLQLLIPACVEHGLSVKQLPGDGKSATIRTAMLYVFVQGWSVPEQSSQVASRQTATATVKAYVLVLAASQVGPRSATWAAEIAIEALDSKKVGGLVVWTSGYEYSSFKDGIWQYRVPLDIRLPVSTANIEITEQELEADYG